MVLQRLDFREQAVRQSYLRVDLVLKLSTGWHAYSLSDIFVAGSYFLPREEMKYFLEKPFLPSRLEFGLDLEDASLAQCHCRLPPPLSTFSSQGPLVGGI